IGTLVGSLFSLLLIVPDDATFGPLSRVAALIASIKGLSGIDAGGLLMTLNGVEPSGMWRILSNLYGISCASDLPLGLGSTDIAVALANSRCSPFLGSLLVANSVYSRASAGLAAQSFLANLVVVAGIPGL